MASRRYRAKNSLNSNVSHLDNRLSNLETRPAPRRVAANSIGTGNIRAEAIDSSKIGIGSVDSSMLAGGSVGSAQIQDAIVTAAKIFDGAVTAVKIAEGAVSAAKLAANSVTSIAIAANAIVNEKLAANAVQTVNIVANAIDTTKIANDAVTNLQIAADAVGSDQLATSAVTGTKIAANTITGNNILAGSVAGNRITANTLSGNTIVANTLFGNTIVANTLSGNTIVANTLSGNSVVANTINGNTIIANSLSGNTIVANTLSGNTIVANTISGNTIIANTLSGNTIIANSLMGDTVVANSLFGNTIVAGSITVDRLLAGTLTGFTIQTAFTGQRVQIGGTDLSNVKFYDSSNTITGEILATTDVFNLRNVKAGNGLWGTGARSSLELRGGSAGFFINNGNFNATFDLTVGSAASSVLVTAPGFSAGFQGIASIGSISASGSLSSGAGITVSSGSVVISNPGGGIGSNFLQVPDTYVRNVQSGRIVYVSPAGTYNAASSSERYKQDIAPYEVDLDKLLLLQPVSFRYKQAVLELGDTADVAHGFIAEQAAEIGLTEFVDFELDENGDPRPDNFRYVDFTAALLSALKKQQQTINILSNKIDTLEARLA